MITGLAKEIEYTEDIYNSISVEDLNNYFKNYFSLDNRLFQLLLLIL